MYLRGNSCSHCHMSRNIARSTDLKGPRGRSLCGSRASGLPTAGLATWSSDSELGRYFLATMWVENQTFRPSLFNFFIILMKLIRR